eukprot:CAMPEP_0114126774 /NCGR_PEP_ID=MMETSP0043_2-20121206/10007_1 /TAXON_ID=464988 /ORGANISM="Hemiselmis andersenii, Strain CCMP644" /LENGTH=30 /DNA_ID= /DNA_START= /DNA_END= /DNA_ORIENTATION=
MTTREEPQQPSPQGHDEAEAAEHEHAQALL